MTRWAHSASAWIIIVALLSLYFTPSIVAWKREVKPMAGVAIVNVFLGWTFLGWVGALVWAAVAEKKGIAVAERAATGSL